MEQTFKSENIKNDVFTLFVLDINISIYSFAKINQEFQYIWLDASPMSKLTFRIGQCKL